MPTQHSLVQLLNMLDSITEGIYCVDLAGECTYLNQRCLEMLGFEDPKECLGKNMHRLIHYQRRDGSVYEPKDCNILAACKNGVITHVIDDVFFRMDGSRFDAEYRSYPIKEDDGSITGAVVTFSDVTLTRAETAHRTHLARLVETSHDAIISKSLDGKIISWNQGASEIYGYDLEEAVGQPPRLLFTEGQFDEEPEILQAVMEGNELPQFHVKRKRKNGEIFDLSITVSPLYNANNKLIGYSSIERDITESQRSQDAILNAITAAKHAERLAKDASKSRTEFLANVSHELRTPMNAIIGMLNLSLEEQLDPLVNDYLSVARTSANSLLELVNEILDFAKLESGTFEIANEPFELREAVDTPAKVLASRASEKGLEILCEIDSIIPTKLIGDGRRIQQIITNLLSNAVKFTNTGEIVVMVRQLRDLPSEVRLRFSVTDTGIGIAAEDQEKILLPFNQADMSSTRQHHGTGLGLSICSELVSLMGGRLKIASEVGKGSQFSFDLTLIVEDDTRPADQLPSELVKDVRVLIVDDNPTNLRILEKIFVSWSMQPIVTSSAEQALRVLDESQNQDHEISLAIVDALMPQVDGFDLAEKVADRKADGPPIVMMQSAADLSLHADRTQDVKVAHYLTKPVSQSELLNAVVDTLDLYSHPSFEYSSRKILLESTHPIRPLNILVVEDLPANQKVANAILSKRGHQVTIAFNGRVAVDIVQSSEQGFDVILMDIQMPVMDGLQATAAIRSLSDATTGAGSPSTGTPISETPIIAMTAHAMQGDREACLAAGMDAYIPKPLDAKRLVELTESIVLNSGTSKDSHQHQTIITELGSVVASGTPNNGDPETGEFPYPKLVEYETSLHRLGGDRELFIEFIEIFMDDSPKLMAELSNAIETRDCLSLEKSAHALKGLMSNFGASPCCDSALKLELAGRNGELESVDHEFSKLKNYFKQLCVELSEF